MVFGNSSVNTIRIYTVLAKNHDVHIIKAILRVGVGNSCIDHYCNGGVIYPVNINYGIVEGYGQTRDNKVFCFHPNTRICMLGYQIPHWDKLKEKVIELALHLPECRYIGWDLAITENNVEVIEGNHSPDHEFLEFIGSERMFYDKITSLY